MGDFGGGLGEWLAGDATDEERRADERRTHAGTFGGRMPSTVREFRRDAGDALTSALHAIGIDTAAAHAAQLAETGSFTGPTFDRLLQQGDTEARAAEQRSPVASGAGEGAGDVAPYAIGAGTGGTAEAAPLAAEGAPLLSRALATGGRVLRGGIVPAGETAAYSGATSRAPTSEGAAEDAIAGGALGFGTGVLGSLLGEGARAVTSPEARRAASRAADRQRIASVRGESRGTISHRDFDSLIETIGRGGRTRDERIARAAQGIRDTGIVGPMSSAGEIADRAAAAERRAGDRMDAIRTEADAAGASVPATAVPDALERYAGEMDPLALGRWADAPMEEARTWREGVVPGRHGAEMRAHPSFQDPAELDRLLTERAGLPQPPRIAEADRRMASQTAREEEMAAAGEPGAAERAARRRTREAAPERSLEDLIAMIEADATPRPGAVESPQAAPSGATSPGARGRRGHRAEPSPEPSPVSLRDLATDEAADSHEAVRSALMERIRDAESGTGLTIPRQRAEDALRILDRTTQWVTPSGQVLAPDTQVARQMRRVVRDSIDDSIAPFLSPERMAEYPQARREYSHARAIGDVVRPAEERAAGRSSLASGMQAAAPIIASGGGAAPAAAAGIGYRALRGRGATIDATALEALSRALDASPAILERWRPRLERARRTGTLGVAHRLLSADPDYATEAERVISGTVSGTPDATAPAAPQPDRARRARAELARRELARRAARTDRPRDDH